MRIFVVKKWTLIRAGIFVLLVIGAIVYTQLAFGSSVPAASQSQAMPVCRVSTSEKVVALTFDTAFGDKDYTQQIMDVLDKENAQATFFVMGLWADKYPDMVKSISKAGFEIGSHSMNHLRYPDLTETAVLEDANDAADLIFQLTGYDTKLIRLPYGAFNTADIMALENAGYIPVKWSLDSLDWKGNDAKKITDTVLSKAESGDIIMFQNNMEATPEALSDIVLGLREDGYKIVKLSDMLIGSSYIVDSQGTQKYFND
jgi:peptidoglycan-N-acetylglucosamine deacetylase